MKSNNVIKFPISAIKAQQVKIIEQRTQPVAKEESQFLYCALLVITCSLTTFVAGSLLI